MNEKYLGSERHKENMRQARMLSHQPIPCKHCDRECNTGNIASHEVACLHADHNAVHCKQCNTRIYQHKKEFCNRSCAAHYNNARRSPESRQKQRESVIAWGASNPEARKSIGAKSGSTRSTIARAKYLDITDNTKTCEMCGDTYQVKKRLDQRFCSKSCASHHMVETRTEFKWGKCLCIPYTTKTGQVINLQSTWEVTVAEYLDNHNIKWSRPKSIPWVDSTGKKRRYYPDFLLEDFNVYLDPKNDRVLVRDKEKLREVSKSITLIVGNINLILQEIDKIVK